MATEDRIHLTPPNSPEYTALDCRPDRRCLERHPRPAKSFSQTGKQRTVWKRFSPKSAPAVRLLGSTPRLAQIINPTYESVEKVTKKRCVGESKKSAGEDIADNDEDITLNGERTRAFAVSWDMTNLFLEYYMEHKKPYSASDNGIGAKKRKLGSAGSDAEPTEVEQSEEPKAGPDDAGKSPNQDLEQNRDDDLVAAESHLEPKVAPQSFNADKNQNEDAEGADSDSLDAKIDPRLRFMRVDELDNTTCDMTDVTVPIAMDLPEDSRNLYDIPNTPSQSCDKREEAPQDDTGEGGDEFFDLDMESVFRSSSKPSPPSSQGYVYPEPPAPHLPAIPTWMYDYTDCINAPDLQLEGDAINISHGDDSDGNEEFLQGFLKRSEASKAAKIADQSTEQKKRDSGAVRSALKSSSQALAGLDKNSPLRSGRETQQSGMVSSPLSGRSAVVSDDMDELVGNAGTAPPHEQRRPLRNISTHQPLYSEMYAIQNLDPKNLAMFTKNNTGRNGGTQVRFILREMKRDGRDHWRREGSPALGQKSVHWKEQLAEYSERPKAFPEEVGEEDSKRSRRKKRKLDVEGDDEGIASEESAPVPSSKRMKKWGSLPDFLQVKTRASARLVAGAQAAIEGVIGTQTSKENGAGGDDANETTEHDTVPQARNLRRRSMLPVSTVTGGTGPIGKLF
ncbi:MAG: hypothetical protein M1831_006606 [Alyxoria varia]|nr:MAG: hypothetical protein M1831_006606 [Alyxoria varia]